MAVERTSEKNLLEMVNYRGFSTVKILGALQICYADTIMLIPEEARKHLDLTWDDKVLFLNLRPPDVSDRIGVYDLIKVVRGSLNLTAKYIDFHKLEPKSIIAITHEAAASGMRLFGFGVVELKDPGSELCRDVSIHYRLSPRAEKGKEMGRIMLCSTGTEKFLAKFSNDE